jgi:single-strand DNA-binding protein
METIKGTLNRVELIGWIGAEPDLRFVASGTAVCSLTIATKRYSGRNENGERQVQTEWTNIELWDKQAEYYASTLHKGSRVRIVGSLQTRSWEDANGQKRFKTVVRGDDVMFLDNRSETRQEPAQGEEPVEVMEELPF